MSLNLAAYVDSVRHKYIDVDGVFGAQCWDQWSHYASTFLGVPSWPTYTNAGGTWPHQGYACNVYHNARAAGLEQWFEILPANATPRAGDVAFWEYGSAWYPWSHVATVLAVTHGGRMLRCLTQNPGYVQIADLTISGIIGYLRPKALATAGLDTSKTPTISYREKQTRRKKKTMLMCYYAHAAGKDQGRWAVFGPGFWLELETQKAANAMAAQLGVNAYITDAGGWAKFKRVSAA